MNLLKRMHYFFRREWRKRWVSRQVFDALSDSNQQALEMANQLASTTVDLVSEVSRLQRIVDKLEKEGAENSTLRQEMLAVKIDNLELTLRLEQRNQWQFNICLN